MKYDLFIKTLERGRDIGFGTKFNISDILQKEFSKPTTIDVSVWNAECAIQIDVLLDMQYKLNLIKFDSLETNKIRWIFGDLNPTWFDTVNFNVWVTVTGLDYLNQFYLRESNFRLNDTIRTNTDKQTELDNTIATNSGIQAIATGKQTKIFRWTAIFAFGAMAVSGFSLWQDFHKDTIQLQLKQKDLLIELLQKKLNLLKVDSSHVKEASKAMPKKA